MIVAASTTLLADSRAGQRGGVLSWALLVVGSVASLAANVAVAEPSVVGRVIAAWPSFALIGAYELLMRQVRHSATGRVMQPSRTRTCGLQASQPGTGDTALRRTRVRQPGSDGREGGPPGRGRATRDLQWQAWRWALDNRADDGSLPSGREIAGHYGRHERWGRLVKRSGAAGEFDVGCGPGEPGLRLVQPQTPDQQHPR